MVVLPTNGMEHVCEGSPRVRCGRFITSSCTRPCHTAYPACTHVCSAHVVGHYLVFVCGLKKKAVYTQHTHDTVSSDSFPGYIVYTYRIVLLSYYDTTVGRVARTSTGVACVSKARATVLVLRMWSSVRVEAYSEGVVTTQPPAVMELYQ